MTCFKLASQPPMHSAFPSFASIRRAGSGRTPGLDAASSFTTGARFAYPPMVPRTGFASRKDSASAAFAAQSWTMRSTTSGTFRASKGITPSGRLGSPRTSAGPAGQSVETAGQPQASTSTSTLPSPLCREESTNWDETAYECQTIVDNACPLRPELPATIGQLVVESGHRVAKKAWRAIARAVRFVGGRDGRPLPDVTTNPRPQNAPRPNDGRRRKSPQAPEDGGSGHRPGSAAPDRANARHQNLPSNGFMQKVSWTHCNSHAQRSLPAG